ncbi:hypothetical protein JAAARDRAFT_29700 [Jaapia argillacea MUCL 33604]|uniref:GRIP domain-containing protein n=1 Tax=Jaapia argillacea MUCL 33604 TaxID=933084 RepID=A0A067QM05_9AGAM|nr:hypothetical protein JAAARDRAFT_29700 [Jaapia argillacea MUCL 33604]
MFSQFRHAVESLAQQPRRSSQDVSPEESHQRSPSADAGQRQSFPFPAPLAETAFQNLRKTLVTQRSSSPGPLSSPSTGPSRRPNLEERLRATFTIGNASANTTPDLSARASPNPDSAAPAGREHMSPTSTPLPMSPVLGPTVETNIPSVLSLGGLGFSVSPVKEPTILPPAPLPVVSEERIPEADVPLPASSSESSEGDNQVAGDVESPSPPVVDEPTEKPVPETEPGAPAASEEPIQDSTEPEIAPAEPAQEPLPEHREPSPPDSPHQSHEESPPEGEIPTDAGSQDAVVPTETPGELLDVEPSSSPSPSEEKSVSVVSVDSQDNIQPSAVAVNEPDIEGLRERLKLVEQRFSDVSTSYKRLQAEKLAADRVLQEFTPVESLKDAEGLRDFLQNEKHKTELFQDEIKRLNGNILRQEERLQELRDTHRLESSSQTALIDRLRKQLEESEALVKASQGSISHAEEESAKRQVEIERLKGEVEKSKTFAKEEEEKRVKAVSLLKTVRQKLVKAEKDREEAVKEVAVVKAKEREEKEKEENEKAKLRKEIEDGNAERERAIAGLKSQFDREVALLRDRQEKELTALRGQHEQDASTAKAAYNRELSNRDSKISTLENSIQALVRDKNSFFDQLQMRQAELESSQSHLEVLQNQATEYQYQLREVNDRMALLNEEVTEMRRNQDSQSRGPSTSPEEIAQMLSAAEAKSEGRIGDLRRILSTVEKERDEAEADWSRKFREKMREMEELRKIVDSSKKREEDREADVQSFREKAAQLQEEVRAYQNQVADLQVQTQKITDVENAARERYQDYQSQINVLEKQMEEFKSREAQLRMSNKTIREELRKVQSSAALLERQRNPGVGFWGSRQELPDSRRSMSSSTESLSRGVSRPTSPALSKDEEEVNLEYLRNVILQFLEHKEMRPQLVRVMSTILHFTPQETRRLVAKV